MDIQTLPSKPKIDKKNILILFLAILNLFLISHVLLVRSLPSTKIQPIATLPTPSQPADPTSTWQTYKNEKYGFEFKYPAELIYKPYSGNINDDGGESIQSIDFRTKQLELGRETISGIRYLISISDFGCELFDRTKTTIDPAISDIENITIDSLPAKLYHFSWDGTEGEVTQIPYNNNNSCIYLSVSYGPNYQSLWENQYNQILSTLKFIDPTSIIPSDWVKETDSVLGISFYHPANWEYNYTNHQILDTLRCQETDPCPYIKFSDNYKNIEDLKNIVISIEKIKPEDITKSTSLINGYFAESLTYKGFMDFIWKYMMIKSNSGQNLVVHFENSHEADQILSTLEFTN